MGLYEDTYLDTNQNVQLPVKDTPDETLRSTQSLYETNPISGGYVNNLLYQQPAAGSMSRSDIFPTIPEPVTQQGVSGKFLSMPTIAPTAPLIPYNLIYEQEQADAKKKKEIEKASQIDLTLDRALNAEVDRNLTETFVNMVESDMRKAQEMYGDNWKAALSKDPFFNLRRAKFNDLIKNYNDTYGRAKDILIAKAENNPFVDEEGIEAAQAIFENTDKLFESKDPKDIYAAVTRITEANGRMVASQNLQKVYETEADILKTNGKQAMWTIANAKDVFNNPLGTLDQKVNAEKTLKSNFIKPLYNDNSQLVGYGFDSDAAKEHWKNVYDAEWKVSTYWDEDGNLRLSETSKGRRALPYKGDPQKFIDRGLSYTQNEVTENLNGVSTGTIAWKRLQLDEDEKKRLRAVPRIAAKKGSERFGNIVLANTYEMPTMSATGYIDGYSFNATDEQGKPVTIKATDYITPIKHGTASGGKQYVVAKVYSPNENDPTTGVTRTVIYDWNSMPDELNKSAHYVDFNNQFYKEGEDFTISYRNDVDPTSSGAYKTGVKQAGVTTEVDPGGKSKFEPVNTQQQTANPQPSGGQKTYKITQSYKGRTYGRNNENEQWVLIE